MDRKQLPVSISDFAKLITGNYYFVDKSLFIKELLDSGAGVTLIPRPRRFGKTINMSMIRYFFEKSDVSRRHLFDGLKIEQHPKCMAKQGQYPVIFLTFKDVKERSWAACQKSIKNVVAEEFRRHDYLLSGVSLDDVQKREFREIVDKSADLVAYSQSLATLTAHLAKHHQREPILLIDEYDAPIHAAFLNNYYDDVISFMRNFLSGGFKDNSNLEFGVLTGILRISKESIFSGLNNLEVNTFLQEIHSDKFGLLEAEVTEVLTYFGRYSDLEKVRAWYDGYQSRTCKLYNPWSIINFTKSGDFLPYWANSSDNAMLKQVLKGGPDGIKDDCEELLRGEIITKEINENIVMPELLVSTRAVWNLLFMSGYLTFENLRFVGRKRFVDLKIPNEEVCEIYDTQILSWFQTTRQSEQQYQSMLTSLLEGDRENFKFLFTRFAQETLGVFDVTGTHPERFYHGFVLGMLASLRESYDVVSNHESGFGRYDVSIFPRDVAKIGIIFEFKVVDPDRNQTLESEAQNALKQIEDRQYEAAMRARGITNIIKIGISFEGKKNLVMFG